MKLFSNLVRLLSNFQLGRLLRLTCLFIPHLLMAGCSDNVDPNRMDEIELKSGNLHAVVVMPASYKTKKSSDTLIAFRCKYPSMGPGNPDAIPQDDDIDVYISLGDHPSHPEYMVENALKSFDPKRPGADYYAGKEGVYDLYRHRRGKGKTELEVTTYIFQGKDGTLVSVEDPGDWSAKYEANRKIGSSLQVKYLISKPIGNDFIKIDEVVTTFIENRLKTKSNKE